MNTRRRKISFASLDDLMPDVDRLLQGHETVGNWSLGQILNHLSTSLIHSVEGYPEMAPWVIRKTVGKLLFRHLLRTGKVKEGIKVPAIYIPRPGLDARAEAEALRAAVGLFKARQGPLAEHPFAGYVSRDDWEKFHCVHFAHHMSFALPQGS